jgi:hypothetical protein
MFPARLLLAALLALLSVVSGCSSDTDEPPATAGPSSGASTSVSPPASPSASSPSADEFAFPDDVKLEFEIPPTGDKTQDAILAAWMNFEKSIVKAALSKNWSDRTYQKYSGVPARTVVGIYLERKRASNSSVVGTRRFFNVAVADGTGVATISACRDDTDYFGRDLKTGKTLRTTQSQRDFAKVDAGMIHRKDGRWVVETYVTREAARACVR